MTPRLEYRTCKRLSAWNASYNSIKSQMIKLSSFEASSMSDLEWL